MRFSRSPNGVERLFSISAVIRPASSRSFKCASSLARKLVSAMRTKSATILMRSLRTGGNHSDQKKKVPSDLIHSPAPHRHARYEALCFGAPCALPLGSPAGVFSTFRINASWHAAAFSLSPQLGQQLVTVFRSPATIATFAASIPGSMFPTCYFAPGFSRCQARSAFNSTAGSG
jgi:hypothetical protein